MVKSHIDVKSNFNREINQAIAEKSNIDNLRTKNNPKLTYGGKVVVVKGQLVEGKLVKFINVVQKHFMKIVTDKWFVTNGAYLEKSQRPTQMLPDTNRMVYNDPIIGSRHLLSARLMLKDQTLKVIKKSI